MNMKKLVLPLLMLLAAPLAFAQMDGPEPDWNNPDEVGNIWVCLDEENEGVQHQGEWECLNGTWFTVDMLPDGKDGFKADRAQVNVLVSLYKEYNGAYKVASGVKGGEKFAVQNRHIYMYKLPSDNLKLVIEETKDVLGSRVFLKKIDMKTASYLVVLPRLNEGFSGEADVRFQDGKVTMNLSFRTEADDHMAEFNLTDLSVMESFKDKEGKNWEGRIKKEVLDQMKKGR